MTGFLGLSVMRELVKALSCVTGMSKHVLSVQTRAKVGFSQVFAAIWRN